LSAGTVFPDGASDVVSGVFVLLLAFAIDDLVAFVALFADSLFGIELFAGFLNLAADAVFAEVEPIRALKARIFTPDFTAEVVVELSEEGGILKLGFRELVVLGKTETR
jgi:hypothetical protein